MRRWRFAGLGLTLLVTATASGCWLVQEGDRKDCDNALRVVCACSSHPCELDPPPDIVAALRRCDESDVRPSDESGDIPLCITDEARDKFCAVLDGVLIGSPAVCDVACDYNSSCTKALESACHDLQYNTCDLP